MFHTRPSHRTQENKVTGKANHINTKSSIEPVAIMPVRKYRLPKWLTRKVDFSRSEPHMER